MVKRCLELNQAFGVIRSGTDGLSEIGTLAEIREATRYIDGRWDIVALGTQRFRITNFDRSGASIHRNERKGEQPSDHVPVVVDVDFGGDDADDDLPMIFS